jgi:transmembrane sensor
MKEDTLNKDLVFGFLEGRSSDEAKARLRVWLEKPGNREQYYLWLEEWENQNATVSDIQVPDFREVLATRTTRSGRRSQFSSYPFLKYAAVVALVLAAGIALIFQSSLFHKRVASGYGEVKPVELPDGTRVILNSNSEIQFPRWVLWGSRRRATLSGEAEFVVNHTSNHEKFVVSSENGFTIEVLGTTFNIFSRERGSRVFLKEGRIKLRIEHDSKSKEILMQPGQLATISNDGSAALTTSVLPGQVEAWKNYRFVFDHTTLQEIAYQIEERFGKKVRIVDSSVANREISGTFGAKSADELLDAVVQLTGIEMTESGGEVHLMK